MIDKSPFINSLAALSEIYGVYVLNNIDVILIQPCRANRIAEMISRGNQYRRSVIQMSCRRRKGSDYFVIGIICCAYLASKITLILERELLIESDSSEILSIE